MYDPIIIISSYKIAQYKKKSLNRHIYTCLQSSMSVLPLSDKIPAHYCIKEIINIHVLKSELDINCAWCPGPVEAAVYYFVF